MDDVKRSRRGVYYDLELSPWEFITPRGGIFKFSSETKLRVYTRAALEKMGEVNKMIDKHGMRDFISDELMKDIYTAVCWTVYREVNYGRSKA